MCGHFGMAGELLLREDKILKQGLIVDALRGDHSTGVLAVPKNGNPAIAKQVGSPYELFNDKRFEKVLQPANRVLLGHNRFATQGAVNKANAHPYEFGFTYGAHNGTLTQWHNLQDRKDFVVDSQALFNHIEEHGVEDAIANVQGAWALVWWDDEAQEINFLRNDQRTLYTAMSTDNSIIYWASEWEMLMLVLNRNNVKHHPIQDLPIDTWMRIPVAPTGALGKAKVKKVAAKKYNPPVIHVTHQKTGGKVTSHGTTLGTTVTFNRDVMRNGVLFEIGKPQLDSVKATYVPCVDADFPKEKIRLYLNQGDQFRFKEGFVLKGNITLHVANEGGYYKVLQSSVVPAKVEEQIEYDDKLGRLEKEKNKTVVEVYKDHKGTYLTKSVWEKKYPHCAWCTGELEAEKDNYLTDGGDAVCPDCSKNEDVKAYL